MAVGGAWLHVIAMNGDPFLVAPQDCILTAVGGGGSGLPRAPALFIRPNPFNPTTAIRFRLRTAGEASLAVHDVTGRLVALLADRSFEAGEQEVRWDGRDTAGRPVASGVYFARLRAEGRLERGKMVLIR